MATFGSELFRNFASMMKKMLLFPVVILLLLVASCGGNKRDAAYLAAKVDSLQKAEQLRQLRLQSGLSADPAEAFFDTLQMCPLPVQTAGGNIDKLGHFTPLPQTLNTVFGYPIDVPLEVCRLPRNHQHRVIMLAEKQDSLPPVLFLYTLDDQLEPIDQLCIYEQKAEERGENLVMVFNDYYITSNFEITLMFAYLKQDSDYPHFEATRRYTITKAGTFEEVIIDL